MKLSKRNVKIRRSIILAVSLGLCLHLSFLAALFPEDIFFYNTLDQLLDTTFRVDIKTTEVVFHYYPDEFYVKGSAVVTFKMRPGQTVPLIQFDPAITNDKWGRTKRQMGTDQDICFNFNPIGKNIGI